MVKQTRNTLHRLQEKKREREKKNGPSTIHNDFRNTKTKVVYQLLLVENRTALILCTSSEAHPYIQREGMMYYHALSQVAYKDDRDTELLPLKRHSMNCSWPEDPYVLNINGSRKKRELYPDC